MRLKFTARELRRDNGAAIGQMLVVWKQATQLFMVQLSSGGFASVLLALDG